MPPLDIEGKWIESSSANELYFIYTDCTEWSDAFTLFEIGWHKLQWDKTSAGFFQTGPRTLVEVPTSFTFTVYFSSSLVKSSVESILASFTRMPHDRSPSPPSEKLTAILVNYVAQEKSQGID